MIMSGSVTVKVSWAGASGTAKLVWKPLVLFEFEADLVEDVMVTILTLKPPTVDDCGAELEGAGALTEARRNEMRALAVLVVGAGVGVTVLLTMF
jgi:hypothetical protein